MKIKFRAWLKEDRIMVFSDSQYSLDLQDLWNFNADGVFVKIQTEEIREQNGEWVARNVFIEPEQIVMQFSGLIDCNGTPIYEGDIVKKVTGLIGEIKFGSFQLINGTASFVGFSLFRDGISYEIENGKDEVLTNIHEQND